VKEFHEQNPTAYQDEIAEFLESEYSIQVHRSTVSRLLKKLGHTHKRTERAAEERDEERAHWRSRLCGWKPNQLVSLDESAANEKTKDRKYGWSLKGLPCKVKQSGQHSTRWSILPAMGLNGNLDYEIFHGKLQRRPVPFICTTIVAEDESSSRASICSYIRQCQNTPSAGVEVDV
jgi:hypothetical protein